MRLFDFDGADFSDFRRERWSGVGIQILEPPAAYPKARQPALIPVPAPAATTHSSSWSGLLEIAPESFWDRGAVRGIRIGILYELKERARAVVERVLARLYPAHI